MRLLRTLLRCYACLFHGLFILFAAGMAVILGANGPLAVNFYLLPWQGGGLIRGLVGLALAGVIVLGLVLRFKLRSLFVLWSLVVLVLVVRYFFFSPYSFTPGTGQLSFALWMILAGVVAVLGASMKPAAKRAG